MITRATRRPRPPALARLRGAFSRREWASLGGMYGVVLLLHVVGFGVLVGFVAPQGFDLGGDAGVYTVGVGVLAYTFGLRHAFDADHIAAVDNTTRKLLADRSDRSERSGRSGRSERSDRSDRSDRSERRHEGREDRPHEGREDRPLSVGFWFSLGHSTVVFVLAFLLSAGVKALAGQVRDGGSGLQSITGVVGASVSGVFLWVLGILNLVVLVGIVRVFRRMRGGSYDERELEEQLNKRGLMNRILGGLTRSVRKPWHIYPIGVLFGLGFDTATEVGLLVLAGGAAVFDLPFYAILVLPVLFAAGMSLADTTDGVFMNVAYGWAFAKPVRKVFYNITITALSVAVALGIGTIELAGVLVDRASIESGPLYEVARIPLDYAGYAIVGLFVVTWAVAISVWRLGRIEERWSARLVR